MNTRLEAAETRETTLLSGVKSWTDRTFRQPLVDFGRDLDQSNTKMALVLETGLTHPTTHNIGKRYLALMGGMLSVDLALATGNTTPSLFWKLHDMAIDPQTHSMGEVFWADVMAAPTWLEMTARLTVAGLSALVAAQAFKYTFRRS